MEGVIWFYFGLMLRCALVVVLREVDGMDVVGELVDFFMLVWFGLVYGIGF